MPRRVCRRDENHAEIADAFRRLGWAVEDTYQVAQYIPGWPDLVVQRGEAVLFVEVKGPKGKLTLEEQGFRVRHSEVYRIVRSLDDMMVLMDSWQHHA